MRSVRECARRAVYVDDDDGEIEVEVISALSLLCSKESNLSNL